MENKIECFIFPELFQDLRGEIKNKDNGKWRAIEEGLGGGRETNKEENSSKEEAVNLVGCKRGSSKQRVTKQHWYKQNANQLLPRRDSNQDVKMHNLGQEHLQEAAKEQEISKGKRKRKGKKTRHNMYPEKEPPYHRGILKCCRTLQKQPRVPEGLCSCLHPHWRPTQHSRGFHLLFCAPSQSLCLRDKCQQIFLSPCHFHNLFQLTYYTYLGTMFFNPPFYELTTRMTFVAVLYCHTVTLW